MNYISLVGAEQVQKAGYAMQSAADQIERSAMLIEEALRTHQNFLNDWLSRFEAVTSGTMNSRRRAHGFEPIESRFCVKCGGTGDEHAEST